MAVTTNVAVPAATVAVKTAAAKELELAKTAATKELRESYISRKMNEYSEWKRKKLN